MTVVCMLWDAKGITGIIVYCLIIYIRIQFGYTLHCYKGFGSECMSDTVCCIMYEEYSN
jgi:hypothetical protein